MLVLSRKTAEEITVADNIRIVIVEIRGDKVRVGIEAPRNISVHRKEIAVAIQNESISRSGVLPGQTPDAAE